MLTWLILALALTTSALCADIGSSCQYNNDCSTPNSHCVYNYEDCNFGTCQCEDTYYTYSSTECRAEIKLGDSCEFDSDCDATVRYAVCSDDDVCVCEGREQVHVDDGVPYCYLWVAGEPCLDTNDTKCLTYRLSNNWGICDGTCSCTSEAKLVGEKCEPYGLGEACDGATACVGNSGCLNDVCSCPENSEWDDDLQACVSTLASVRTKLRAGEVCNDDYLEASGLICGHWLDCASCPGENEDICQQTQEMLDEIACVTDSDCTTDNSYCHHEYTLCGAGYCKCDEGFYLASNLTCRAELALGEECVLDEDCQSTTEYSICNTDSVCACAAGEQVYSDSRHSVCYEFAMDEACTTNDQCLSWRINQNGQCTSSSTCGCLDTHHRHGEECLAGRWRQSCDVNGTGDGACFSNMICTATPEFTCECPQGTKWDYQLLTCISTAVDVFEGLVVGQTCTVVSDAESASICNPWLKCDSCPGGDPQNFTCQRIDTFADIEMSCELDAECTEPNSHCAFLYDTCEYGQCRCNHGYFLDATFKCTEALVLQSPCTHSEDCHASVAYSRCITGVCQCATDELVYEYDGVSYCYKHAAGEVADPPVVNACLTYRLNPHAGALVDGQCGCQPEYVLNDQFCDTVKWNENCVLESTTMHCVQTTECMEIAEGDSRCRCPDVSTVWDVGYGRCVSNEATKNLDLGDECNEDYESAVGLLCSPSLRCARCSSDTPRTCKAALEDSGRCSTDDDCLNSNTHCSRLYASCEFGTCQCDQLFYPVSESQCRRGALIGEPCAVDLDCSTLVDGSICDDAICTCGPGEDIYEHGGKSYCYLKSAGELCNTNDDCLSYRINPEAGECTQSANGRVCLCKVEYKLDGQVCLPSYYGESCDVDGTLQRACTGNSQCTTLGEDKVCACLYWQSWNYFSDTCVSNAANRNGENESCDRLNDICKPWLVCDTCPWEDEQDTVCQVIDEDINRLCTSNSDCISPNSYCGFLYEDCTVGECRCTNGYYFASDFTCRKEKIVGTECDDAEDCQKMLSNSICTQDKVCACKPGEEVYEYGGKSYCYVNLAGEQCHWSTTNECLTYRINPTRAACRDTLGDKVPRCDCLTSYLLVDQACVLVPYSEECRFDNNNDRICVDSAVCMDNGSGTRQCLCPEGHRWDMGLSLCVHDNAQKNLPIGEECNTFYNASGLLCSPGLVCGTCVDDDVGPETCHPSTGDIDGACSVDSDCLALNSFCSLPYEGCGMGVCTCDPEFYAPVGSSLTCLPLKALNEPCETIEECRRSVAYSTCEDNQCVCGDQEKLYEEDGKQYCYLSAARELCYYPSDCLSFRIDSDTGDCDGATCGCREEYILEGEKCVTAKFGDSCLINEQEKNCERNSICDDSTKQCACVDQSEWLEDYQLCVHIEATTHLTAGEECNLDYGSPGGNLCDISLDCDACNLPGEDNPHTCQARNVQ